mmetsp:Transcript_34080/g.101252  ORF Transcript_34080/g.101252 Transcript_34080/m.101252 type:complete len:206 (-) Transcript_34080:44-661(-)
MGGSQTRYCGGTCDRQHQLSLPNGEAQAYPAWEFDVTGDERTGADAKSAGKPTSEPAGQQASGLWGGAQCCASDAECLPRTPAAASKSSSCLPGRGGAPRAGSEDGLGSCVELLIDIVKRQAADDLGMKVLHRGIGILVVAEIYPGGAVELANLANARAGEYCLEVGDQIAVVNGVGGEDQAMAEEFRRARELTLGVRRVQRGAG